MIDEADKWQFLIDFRNVLLANTTSLTLSKSLEVHIKDNAIAAHKKVFKELINNIQGHKYYKSNDYEQSEVSYYYENNRDLPLGSLEFLNPYIYLSQMTEDHVNDTHLLINSANNEYITYAFVMLGFITGGFEHYVAPNFGISFVKPYQTYHSSDILKAFSYHDRNLETFVAFDRLRQKFDSRAYPILQADKTEVEKIIQKLFAIRADECNTLKDVPEEYRAAICAASNDPSDSDCVIKTMMCLDVFRLADNPDFCQKLQLVDHVEL